MIPATSKTTKRTFIGEIISDSMNKTRVVRVESVKQHPKYEKRYLSARKFKVHDEKNEYKMGDKVKFIECRPLSSEKRWRIVGKA